MIKKVIISSFLAASLVASITKVDIGGSTFPIKEENLVKLIEKYVEDNKEMIEAKLNKAKAEMKHKIENYKPKDLTKHILPATEDAVFYPDPTYTTEFDVKDQNGNIIYPQGYKFNPLHYVTLQERYVFIDYTRQEQINWVIEKGFHADITTRLILVDGRVFDAIKFFQREVFYSNDLILNRFGIKATPSIATQEGDRIKIEQFYVSANVKKSNTGEKENVKK